MPKKSQEPDPRPNLDKIPPLKILKTQNKNRGKKIREKKVSISK